jgi:hypothetical protein
LYALAFVDEVGPLYALYTLWFVDNGLSAAFVSALFLVWALVGLVVEVPSGALADRVDRRRLLAAAFGLRAVGIALWLVWPTAAGALVGAMLWSAHSALASGAWEAAIHDQLSALGEARRYTAVMARINQCSYLGVAAGTLVAALSVAGAGASIALLGWVTVALHVPSIVLILSLARVDPDQLGGDAAASEEDHAGEQDGAQEADEPTSYRAWLATLQAGAVVAVRSPLLFHLVLIGGVLEGLFLFDDYAPLLARQRGVGDAVVPLVVLVVFVGAIIGDEVAARLPRLPGWVLGVGLMAAAGCLAAALGWGEPWALVLVGPAYLLMEAARVAAEGRLQARAPQAVRATVTSVRAFFAGVVGMVAFAVIGVLASGEDPRPGLVVATAVLALMAVATMRWLPGHEPAGERAPV